MTDAESLEMFIVGDLHVTIYRETIDDEPFYSANFEPEPGESTGGCYKAGHLEDLATAAQAAEAIILMHRGMADVLDTARRLARLGLVPHD